MQNEMMIKERKEGLSLVAKLKPLINNLTIKTQEDYLRADEKLSTIMAARHNWKGRMAEILDPLKQSLALAKQSYKSAESLYDEIDKPMIEVESTIKDRMRDFKLEERRLLLAAEEEARRAQAKIEEELRKKDEAERKAKTPAMANKILDAKARLQQALADSKAQEKPAPVKGSASISRAVKSYRVDDLLALVKHVAENPDLIGLLEVDNGQLQALFRLSSPEVGGWLPGVTVYEDINIAGRRK